MWEICRSKCGRNVGEMSGETLAVHWASQTHFFHFWLEQRGKMSSPIFLRHFQRTRKKSRSIPFLKYEFCFFSFFSSFFLLFVSVSYMWYLKEGYSGFSLSPLFITAYSVSGLSSVFCILSPVCLRFVSGLSPVCIRS
jgi:hypothetical protein